MLWVFLAFVVLLSGVVAYAADTIARKAGRKHIRWFGLRPKTTALVVAVLSGMGISAASLTAFLLLNKNAVDVIAAADQLRPQLESLRQEYAAAQDDLKAASVERDRAQKEAQRLGQLQEIAQRDLRATRADLSAAQQAEQRLKAEAAGLQGRVKTLTGTIGTLEARATQNRTKLQNSEAALKASRDRAQALDSQVLDFRARTALAQQEAQNAQDRAADVQARADQAQARAASAEAAARAAQTRAAQAQTRSVKAQAEAQVALVAAQAQVQAARTQAANLRVQVEQLGASRLTVQRTLQNATAALAAAQTARTQAERQRQAAQQARDTLAAERTRVAAQRDQLVAERDRITKQRDQAQGDLILLQQQQLKLKSSNDALSRELATARATLGRLQDEYSSSRAELNASRNTDLTYPKNDLVYAAVVPSVRNLDSFLRDAERAAQNRGARGTPSVRLAAGARSALETKLRGLNASTFVQCRAAQNAALGFPVDLSCDARANNVLFRPGEVIRRVSINLKAEPRVIQEQINELVKDTVVDITTRGVPGEYIANQGLDVTEFIDLLARLNARTDATAVVGIAARDDVKPSTRVELYPRLP